MSALKISSQTHEVYTPLCYLSPVDRTIPPLSLKTISENLKLVLKTGDEYKLKQVIKLELSFYTNIINAQLSGFSSLPYGLGLSLKNYQQLLTLLGSKYLIDTDLINKDKKWHDSDIQAIAKQKKSRLLNELNSLRTNEKTDLEQLLIKHKSNNVIFSGLTATIIATACLSSGHLWKSLGFETREMLSEWIALNFPSLHAKNNKGMRWKRFFYLQLCQQGGDYVCRAPSCESCSSFTECFLPT